MTPEQCEEFWNTADKDGDGELTFQELAIAVKRYRPSITDKECNALLLGIDKNGDNKISKKEFKNEMAVKPKRSQSLMAMFKRYDRNGDGTLSRSELRKLVNDCFSPDMVEDVVARFLKYSDMSGDGQISFDEFKEFFG
ncbi:Rhomboid-related protein 2 [Mactra antiquata]